MTNKNILGGILATIGALMGILVHFILFPKWYYIGMSADSAEPGCEILLKYIHPLMTDFGILGGIFLAVAAYGFFSRKSWAFLLSTIGLVLALLGSWFINVPYMAADLPPIYFSIFGPYIILYFLLVRWVGGIPWSRTLLAMFTGIAYIFCFMNGVSSTSRIITHGDPIFVLVQRLHLIGMLGWAVVTVGLLTYPSGWMRVVGLVAGVTEMVVGFPLAAVTGQQLGRFSLFALAPVACTILIVIFVWPGLWDRLTGVPTEK